MNRDEILHIALGMQVNYQGIFNMPDLLVMIDSFFKKKGYTKHIMGHKESRTEKGMSLNLRLRPFKQVKSNKLEVQVWLSISDMTEIEKEIDNIKVKLNKGKVKIVIDAFVLSDMRGKWEARAEYTFIRTIFDKFLFRSKSKDYAGMVKADATELRDELSSFLNLNKFLF
ncbi:hypothetical protein JXC34_04425 [Candidatus Woesearchaeota archaeon]|nr:hypothetical protein [Candidatus Woesearchaeota archaeon]